jgi:hypothetical protein
MALSLLSTGSKRQHGCGREGHQARPGGEARSPLRRWANVRATWVLHIVAMDDTDAVVLRKRLALGGH